MPYFKSPLIYTASTKGILPDHVIEIDDEGKIISIDHFSRYPASTTITHIPHMIMPGMVNAHCHLELSHMKGRIASGTGLVEFIKSIVTQRNADINEIQNAIQAADAEMYKNGIVAVGDISNVIDSFEQKAKGRMYYHTFVEAFDLMVSDNAPVEYNKSLSIYNKLKSSDRNKKSIVPHAPYSVSDTLFSLINNHRQENTSTSIHHQETEAENLFVSEKKGALVDFFLGFGISLDQYTPHGEPASHRVMDHMASNQKTLLVHNTMSTTEDIKDIEAWNREVYWVTCPNANLYIENRLPQYKLWIDEKAKVCIGTDSLASNWQLNILEEMITIQKYQSDVSTENLIEWATINGAKALGFDDLLGSIEVGKSPGLVQIDGFEVKERRFNQNCIARRV